MTYLTDDQSAGILLAAPGQSTSVATAAEESPAVRRAVRDLVRDLVTVCGGEVSAVASARGARLVVGTLGVSPLVDDAVATGALDVSGLRGPDGALLWEGFAIQTVGDQLFVVGADRRGTVFGVYDLCAVMGVSPWWWFADVPVRTREHVTVRRGTAVVDHPSVRYRGVFLNDEEELDAWARAHTSDGTIGPETYARVFELILRLKGNYLWPAMHVNGFNADPENGRLADEMGVVIGTSHCDILLRSNQHEWAPWQAAQDEHVEYDYSIPGRNREKVREYWAGSVEQNRNHEVGWTVGMRGIHDSGFVTSAIDADAELSEPQKAAARVALLEQTIRDQRQLLVDGLGEERGRACLQTFVPYKEVLPLYDAGLDVPDDVTIVWSDDSFGYIRRFPSEVERTRSGGHGLYFHASYWSPPPRSYLFISSMPLAHMKNELRKAYERGIRTMWVCNIGALKPLEQDMDFFLRYGWEVGQETTTADVTAFTQRWTDSMFSGQHGARVAELNEAFAQITNVRKIEHLTSRAFSQTAYGDEAGRRLARLRSLYDEITAIHASLPAAEQDAFFQLFVLKMHASYLVNAQFFYADRSTLADEQGKAQSADRYLAISRAFEAHLRALLRFYNTVMSGGKWAGIMTPDAFPPPAMALHPAARPALRIGAPGLGVVAWGETVPNPEPRLTFSPYGTREKWIEVFTTGAGSVGFSIEADDWIEVSERVAAVSGERRIAVRVPDGDGGRRAGREGRIVVRSASDGRTVVVTVVDEPRPAQGASPSGGAFLEADGYVSIAAADADERHDAEVSRWVEVPGLGRYTGSLLEARGSAGGASLDYRMHLVSAGAFLLELHRFPSLDSTGRIRVGVSVDDLPSVVVESPTTDEHRGAWEDAVVENVERLTLRLPFLSAGAHTLRLHAIDEWFAFSRLVVYTSTRLPTALGPPSSARSDRPRAARLVPDPAPDDPGLDVLDAVRRDVYRVDPADVPLPPVVFVGRTFWDSETTFTRNEIVEQSSLGAPRLTVRPDGTKDALADLGTGPVVERDGSLAIEAEYALAGTADGYLTPSLDEPVVGWTHTQSETAGGTGLALHVDVRGRRWDDPRQAPGFHVRIDVTTPGTYRVWALVKFDGLDDDSCVLALDGTPQPVSEQLSGGDLFTFGTQQIWVWMLLSDLDITAGLHTLSVLARESRLRVDRLYLTLGDERPPVDAEWPGRCLTGAS